VDDAAQHIADNLLQGSQVGIFLGNLAQHHPQAAQLHTVAFLLSELLGARLGFLGEAANSVGGYIAGALPGKAGMNAAAILGANGNTPRKAYLLLGVEPEFDCYDGAQALAAVRQAEFVVALSPFQHQAVDYADALLPISPFTETAGTFVSTEGRVQSFSGVVQPLAETRPAWKVLRVLGNLLAVAGFDYDSSEAVRQEILAGGAVADRCNNRVSGISLGDIEATPMTIERIGEVPIYRADALVRRAASLQNAHDAQAPVAAMSGTLFGSLGLRDGDQVRLSQRGNTVVLPALRDDSLPANCIRVPAAHPQTVALGALFGELTAERIAQPQQVAV
jgi:NADH-quinone oxidoreductase subunit G